ncbi:MAG: PTS sugar transporter subunit IIA [Longicatena sp.]
MKDKHQEIFYILEQCDTFTSSKQIALKMNITTRSVKNYIKEMNQEYPNCIESSQKGYRLLRDNFHNVKSKDAVDIPQNQKERINYIIRSCLQSVDASVDIYTLADDIYVSLATIKRDILSASNLCETYELKLELHGDLLTLAGKEKDKRNLITYLFQQEYENNNLDINKMQFLFPEYDLDYIKKTITNKCKKYHYTINGYAIHKIVLDTVISIDRIRNSFLTYESYQEITFNYHELLLAKEISKDFEQFFQIVYNEEELKAFTILLFSHLLRVDYQEITSENLINIVGNETYQLSRKIFEETNSNFLDTQNKDFFTRFTLHLSNLLLRAKTNYINNNLLTENIKISCPLLFDFAVNISNIIYRETGFTINDDEIAYIALHIGSLLDKEKDKMNCALVISNYYNFSDDLEKRFIATYDSLFTIDIIKEVDLEVLKKYDIVISTYKFSGFQMLNGVLITNLLTERDIQHIQQKQNDVLKYKQQQRLKQDLLRITDKNFFYQNLSIASKEDVIKYIVAALIKENYVESSYLEEVLYREQISSTAFNLVAVPHSMKMSAHRTMVSFSIHNKPIKWGNRMVNIVILFAIHEDDKVLFHKIFDELISLLIENKNVEKIMKCSEFFDFIETLTALE